MNPKLAALLILLVAVVAIVESWRRFRRGRLPLGVLLLWSSIWSAMAFFALFPGRLDRLMVFVNMGNRLFFLTTTAILLLFVLVFRQALALSRGERRVNRLVRHIAILEHRLRQRGLLSDEGDMSDRLEDEESR